MKVFGQLERAQIENLAADPTGANLVAGRMWFRTDTLRFRVYDGSAIKEFVDLIEAQTLQNKILESAQLNTPTIQGDTTYNELGSTPTNPAAGNHKIYFKNDGKAYTLDSAGNEVELGAGGGGSGKNYFDDTSANIDNTVGSWTTDDGVGGAAVGLTLAVTSAVGELLSGAGSLKLTKDAADRSAEFIKVASETIDPADRGRPLYGSFEFNPITGYVSSDLVWEVYDVTNAAVLYSGPSSDLELLNSKGRFNWVTYLEDTTAQVEFRLRMNNANTNSFEVSLDEFKFGPAAQLIAPYKRSVTIDVAGSGNFISGEIQVERIGNQVTIMTTQDITHALLPSPTSAPGLLPDWATPPVNAKNTSQTQTTLITIMVAQSNGALQFTHRNYSGTGNAQTATTNGLTVSYTMPNVGDNVVNTNEFSQQTMKASIFLNGNQTVSTTASTKVGFNTVDYDTHGMVDIGNNEFIIRKTGYHKVEMHLNIGALTADEQFVARIAVNGSEVSRTVDRSATSDIACDLSRTLFLTAGDTVSAQVSSTADTSYSVRGGLTGADSYMQVVYVPDFTTIGVVKNEETIEVAQTSNAVQITPGVSVWYAPDLTWNMTLSPGTWELLAANAVQSQTATSSDSHATEVAFATSSTPGTGILQTFYLGAVRLGAPHYKGLNIVSKPIVLTQETTIYMHIRALGGYGTYNVNSLGWRGDQLTTGGLMWARRIK